MTKFKLKLYVTGHTPRSQAAIDNLNRLLNAEGSGHFDLSVIDVLDRPELAEDERILATPTLIREVPVPTRRIIGDLSDQQQVLHALDVQSHSTISTEPGKEAE